MTNKEKSESAPKRWLFFIVKIALSVAALFMAFRMVSRIDFGRTLKDADHVLFVLAIALYAVSQFLSSERLRLFINQLRTGYMVSQEWNLTLYFIGMAYNLFLPGGIGGDAYKVFVYDKKINVGKKKVVASLLIDRLVGLLAIGLFLSVLSLIQVQPFDKWLGVFWFIPMLIFTMVLYSNIKKHFPRFERIFGSAIFMSILVQLVQLASFYCIIHSVGIEDHNISLFAVFLFSSLATAIPVFMGGIGARELVFAAFAGTFGYDSSHAVSAALMFSIVVVINSVPGLFLGHQVKSDKGFKKH